MLAEPPCTNAPQSGALDSGDPNSPDLLRKERFGGLYYSRSRALFTALLPTHARLLVDSIESGRTVLEAAVANPPSLSDLELTSLVASWRAAGMLDHELRCEATVIDEDRSHGALTGPLVTHLQLTRQCNLTCAHCFVPTMATRAPDELALDQITALFSELQRLGSPVVVIAGGEPMLRPDFFEIIEELDTYQLDAWVCTNGTRLTPERSRELAQSPLRGVSISLDGPDAASHDALRGEGQFERAVRGIRNLLEAGQRDVQVRVTVTPHNVDRLGAYAALAAELGVPRVAFKPYRRFGVAADASLEMPRLRYSAAIESTSKAWPAEGPEGDFGDGMPVRTPAWTKIIPAFGCVGGTTVAAVTYDGKVVGCGAVLSPDDWTLHEHSFAECWGHAPGMASWRSLAGNSDCDACENYARCGGGCRARAVGAGRTMNGPDPWAYCSDASAGVGASAIPESYRASEPWPADRLKRRAALHSKAE